MQAVYSKGQWFKLIHAYLRVFPCKRANISEDHFGIGEVTVITTYFPIAIGFPMYSSRLQLKERRYLYRLESDAHLAKL